jgi:hypothetical protein
MLGTCHGCCEHVPMSTLLSRLQALAAVLVLLPGCTLVQLRQESGEFESSTVLAGRVDCPADPLQPLVVAAIAVDGPAPRVAHHARLRTGGGRRPPRRGGLR